MSALPNGSDADIVGYCASVIEIDAQTAVDAFDRGGMIKQTLGGREAAGLPVKESRLCSVFASQWSKWRALGHQDWFMQNCTSKRAFTESLVKKENMSRQRH